MWSYMQSALSTKGKSWTSAVFLDKISTSWEKFLSQWITNVITYHAVQLEQSSSFYCVLLAPLEWYANLQKLWTKLDVHDQIRICIFLRACFRSFIRSSKGSIIQHRKALTPDLETDLWPAPPEETSWFSFYKLSSPLASFFCFWFLNAHIPFHKQNALHPTHCQNMAGSC